MPSQATAPAPTTLTVETEREKEEDKQKAAEEKSMRDKIRNYQRNDMIDAKTNVHVDLNFYSVPKKFG